MGGELAGAGSLRRHGGVGGADGKEDVAAWAILTVVARASVRPGRKGQEIIHFSGLLT